MNNPTTPEQLAAALKREADAADDYYEQLEKLQELGFRYYEAQPFGNEKKGRSSIVLPDVQETCDGMLASVLQLFVSGDRVVEFEATDDADEQAADDATSGIDYLFMRKQDGYRVLNDFIMDGLQRKIGILKSCEVVEEKVSREWIEFSDPLEIELMQMMAVESGLEIEIEDIRGDETGGRVLVKEQRVERQHMIVAVPTREYRFSPLARHEDEADYQAHVRAVTRSDLVGMGFDRQQVYDLPEDAEDWVDQTESENLDSYTSHETTEALQKVRLHEEYARIDVDGDGIAERVKVYRVENTILRWASDATDEMGEPVEGELAIETIDDQPFAVGCPFPRQHRIVGYSLADKIMDVQYLRSHTARQMIDGMAYANMPRPYVDTTQSDATTINDLLNPMPGSPVRGKGPSGVTNLQNNFNIGDSLQMLEWVSREKEARAGVGRATPTLDENSLNNLTATEFAGRQGKSESMQEYIARNMAETLSRAFMKLYRMMRSGAEPFRIRVDGNYRDVDPSTWPETVNMRVRVGLGSNSKDKRVGARMALLGPIQAAMAEGLAGPEHAFNWMDGMARDTGVGQGEDYMFDPSDPEVKERLAQREQQPDPAIVEAQGKLQLEGQKAQANAGLAQMKAEADIETQREKHRLEMQVARERAALEMELARDKAAAEIELAQEKMRAELAMRVNVPDNRPGGDLDK